jgi:hypothetical protein
MTSLESNFGLIHQRMQDNTTTDLGSSGWPACLPKTDRIANTKNILFVIVQRCKRNPLLPKSVVVFGALFFLACGLWVWQSQLP